MKDDVISKQAALDALGEKPLAWMESEYAQGLQNQWVWDVNVIKALPSVQPERKQGKWEMLQMPISPPVYKCSVCGSHALQSMTGCLMNRHYEANLTNYCPNCGARLEGEIE